MRSLWTFFQPSAGGGYRIDNPKRVGPRQVSELAVFGAPKVRSAPDGVHSTVSSAAGWKEKDVRVTALSKFAAAAGWKTSALGWNQVRSRQELDSAAGWIQSAPGWKRTRSRLEIMRGYVAIFQQLRGSLSF